MRKKVFGVVAMAAIAAAASWNFSQNKSEVNLSDLALANVEALANGEGSYYECYTGGCRVSYMYDCWLYMYGNPYKFCPDAWGS